MRKKIAALAMTGMLVGGAGAGMVMSPMTALAADTTTTVTAQATARTPMQWATDAMKGLVDDGTITQEQSDKVAAALEEAKPDRGPGGGGPGGRGGFAPGGLDEAATVLGVTADELHTSLHDGKTIASIAQEKNVELQKVIDALVAASNTKVDERLASGDITQERADEMKSKTTERVTEMVNNTRPERGGPGRDRLDEAPTAS